MMIEALPIHPDHLLAALLHSLWQGAAAASIVFALLRLIPASRPSLRSGAAFAGLLAVVAAAALTYAMLMRTVPVAEESTALLADNAVSAPVSTAVEALPAPSPVSTQNDHAASPQPRATAARLLVLWLLGVGVMLLRVMRLTIGVQHLCRGCEAIANPSVLSLIDELRSALGVSRRVSAFASSELVSPAALGLFWPCILLPASAATGLSPEHLRAVLAHELAHIRRHDYLVNFLQLIIEAFFYFNPAVWWLSRQVRVEREACCDAQAASVSGGAEDYAAALAWAARLAKAASPSLAPTFAGDAPSGALLDRARRLLLPHYRPALHLRRHSVALGAALTLTLFFGLYQGSMLSVRAAEWMLSDQERAEALTQLSNKYNPSPRNTDWENDYVEVAGILIAPEGVALEDGECRARSEVPNHSGIVSLQIEGDRVFGRAFTGEVYIEAEFPRCTPVVLGPFSARLGEAFPPFEIRLAPARMARIRLAEPDGTPIAGATVSGGRYLRDDGLVYSIKRTTDASGIIELEQASPPVPFMLRTKVHGFAEAKQAHLLLQDEETFEWTLQRVAPMKGLIVDRVSGAPLPGATIALLFDDWRGCARDGNADPIDVTDSEGRFRLEGLSPLNKYYFSAQAPGYGVEVFSVADPHPDQVQAALVPLYVQGRILGDLTQLDKDWLGQPVIHADNRLYAPGMSHECGGRTLDIPVYAQDGVGLFRIEGLQAGELGVQAGVKRLQLQVNQPIEDLIIDLNDNPADKTRPLIVAMEAPPDAEPASGKIELFITEPSHGTHRETISLELQDGRAETLLQTPARVRMNVITMAGFLPVPATDADKELARLGWDIPVGTDPFTVTIPLQRAGGITGRVFLPDGTPAKGARIFVSQDAEGLQWPGDYYLPFDFNNKSCNSQGEFAVLPLPIGAPMRISASMGFARSEQPFMLTPETAIASVEMHLPVFVDASVRVLRPDGSPMPNVELSVRTSRHITTGHKTDGEGRCVLSNLDPAQEYHVRAEPLVEYQPGAIVIAHGSAENIIRLEKGLAAEGVILDADTLKPLPGFTVTAFSLEFQSHAITDAEGRFRFTNLPPGEFSCVNVFNMNYEDASTTEERTFTAGQSEAIRMLLQRRSDQ